MVWRVSLVPVPQAIRASPPTSSTTARSTPMCSSSSRVVDSPVVAATTSPCEPFSSRKRASLRTASSSTAPSGVNGVAIAVNIPRNSVIVSSVPVAALQEALETDREGVRQAADPAHGEQHAGHERATVDRVVTHAERLALPTEDDLL